jgi:hypothetical protein
LAQGYSERDTRIFSSLLFQRIHAYIFDGNVPRHGEADQASLALEVASSSAGIIISSITAFDKRSNNVTSFTDYLVVDFLGGPRPWKLAWVINFQKAGTFVYLLALIAWYENYSTAAWVYMAMQGSYGLAWIIKGTAFPDGNWQQRITIGGGINAFLVVLGWYWVFGWLLISGVSQPDYLGEMMIHGSFAMMVWHWLPVVVLAWIWLGIFAVNVIMKEASMSRYPERAAYKKRSWWLIPFVL